MEYRNFGRTGLKISRLIVGGAHIGERLDEQSTRSVVDAAWEAGINAFYTADSYNAGAGEEILGKILHERRDDVVIILKTGFRGGSARSERNALVRGEFDYSMLSNEGGGLASVGLSRKHLVKAIEASLRRLNTEYIDVYETHYWDRHTPIEETLDTLNQFVRDGKVRYLGCSQLVAWQLYKALWTSDTRRLARFEALQTRYNLCERVAERELFPACSAAGVSVLAFGSLAGGLLAGNIEPTAKPTGLGTRQQYIEMYWNDDNLERIERLKALAKQCGRAPGELAQGWVLAQEAVTALQVGPYRPEEISSHVSAVEHPLSRDELEATERIAVSVEGDLRLGNQSRDSMTHE